MSSNRTGKSFENGTATSYSYNSASRLTQMKHTKGYFVISSSNSEVSASAWPPQEGAENRFLFTGRELVRRIDLYDHRNRVYSPDLGRFLQTDPIRFDAWDGNIYRYVGNGIARFKDPYGLLSITDGVTPPDPIGGNLELPEVPSLEEDLKLVHLGTCTYFCTLTSQTESECIYGQCSVSGPSFCPPHPANTPVTLGTIDCKTCDSSVNLIDEYYTY